MELDDISANSKTNYSSILQYNFNKNSEANSTMSEFPPCSASEFEELLYQADELLADGKMAEFIQLLLNISSSLDSNQELWKLIYHSHLGIRLSDIANPQTSDPRSILLISDLLTNLTANDPNYSTNLITRNDLLKKDDVPGFFSAHISFIANENVTFVYLTRVIPVLYNIASCWDVNQICNMADLLKVFQKISQDNEISFLLSFLFINIFRASSIVDEGIIALLKSYVLKYILQESPLSINFSWILYYFFVNSPAPLMMDENIVSLLSEMLKTNNELLHFVSLSILSIIAYYIVRQEDEYLTDVTKELFDNFDFNPVISLAMTIDSFTSSCACSVITNMSVVSENIMKNMMNCGIFKNFLSLLVDGSIQVKKYSFSFISFAISKDISLVHELIDEKIIETLCEMVEITELLGILLPVLDLIITNHPEAKQQFIDSEFMSIIDESVLNDETGPIFNNIYTILYGESN